MHSFASRALAALALCALAAPRVAAQTVGGHVVDRGSRHLLEGVVVRVLGPGDTVLVQTTTDSSGVFYAALPHAATVRLHFGLGGASEAHSDSLVVHADEFVQRDFVVELPRTYLDLEVEKQVSTVPRQGGPRYPAEMKDQNVEGEVLAQFVVDTTGRALIETFRPLRSTNAAFTRAVRDFVAVAQFYPAEVAGRKVRQLVQQPFTFSLGGPRIPMPFPSPPISPRGQPRP